MHKRMRTSKRLLIPLPSFLIPEGGAIMKVSIQVNGAPQEHETEPRRLLVHFLREECGLTGTHIGCETGLCGACTILVDGAATKSCMMLAVQAEGRAVTTIE